MLYFYINYVFAFKCGTDLLHKENEINYNEVYLINKEIHNRKLTSKSAIRIYYDWSEFDTQTIATTSYKTQIKTLMNQVKELIAKFIKVTPTSSITIPSTIITTSCKVTSFNTELVYHGIEADIIIFPIWSNTLLEIEASAKYCVTTPSDNHRPIAGYIYLNTNYVFNKGNFNNYFQKLILHELTHILVFDTELFDLFSTKPTSVHEVNGISRTLISSTKVLEYAKSYFGCDSWTGVELENLSNTIKPGSHWESRIMLGDLMIGFNYEDSVISEITLALFEDSGWYEVNYYTGGLFRYGKGQGCDFVNAKCVIDETVKSSNEFCWTESANMCLAGRLTKGYCGLKTGISISKDYQYFTDISKGGNNYADYCPIAISDSSSTQFYYNSCGLGATVLPEVLGEKIEDDSICVISSLTWKNKKELKEYKGKHRAICHSIYCDTTNNKVKIKIGSNTIICPKEGGKITNDKYDGEILCPDYNLVCTGSSFCNDMIKCIEIGSRPLSDTFTYGYIPVNSQVYVDTDNSITYKLSSKLLYILLSFIM